ncbi:MAG: excinuclease ABC subunit UvrC [Lachnospiraceae bacterium]|nr:excinuclease ABC subunit UvrC [Lachnospiraceae bacterium]MCH4032197.1 excinuclease ABC subunit UvrC [Lachnospiraceae bacterium]MCH4108925.1 excinuclease ABC subunit UvrC [Lachnospiraceae bacterium]MCI1332327.1 excinuclease ABC subunit UvrC [Lachnospiraceae bacterium]MCI1361722.1 excinuclease ABC subunit UvrC [Lachnospiraceae bacterium]
MHDANDVIIYVGKAVVLKNRVRQYFQSSRNLSPKIQHMVSHIAWFEYIVVSSELEALVLESNLIKRYHPHYNTMLTDDKTYPFIKVTVTEEYPRVLFSRDMKHDKSRYFGPYTSAWAVKSTIGLLCRLYKIRTCTRRLPQDIGKERPCINYEIGICSAPCQGYISKGEYREQIQKVISFLNGHYDDILDSLTQQMQKASDELRFEDAASLRDLIRDVKQVAQKQKITSDDGEDRDVIGAASTGNVAVVQIFFIRGGRMIGRDHFRMAVAEGDKIPDIVSGFLKQYYGGTPYIPHYILLQSDIDDREIIEKWLTSRRQKGVIIQTPQRGQKEKLVALAEENARMVLVKDEDRERREQQMTVGAQKEVAGWLGLTGVRRVEAYDISNTDGVQSVGSMVVFTDGRPDKNEYRKFRIQTVKGPDDYKSMKEVLTRRFTRGLAEQNQEKKELGTGFSRFPDLILMDGGRGQVNVALEVLDSLGITIPVAGMVKDDHHNTRGLYYHNVEIPIDRHSEGFKLITRVQDEAHRFAITYHRQLRARSETDSVLDSIPGIGPARRKALMRAFQDIRRIREASEEELAAVDGMNAAAAKSVWKTFHG